MKKRTIVFIMALFTAGILMAEETATECSQVVVKIDRCVKFANECPKNAATQNVEGAKIFNEYLECSNKNCANTPSADEMEQCEKAHCSAEVEKCKNSDDCNKYGNAYTECVKDFRECMFSIQDTFSKDAIAQHNALSDCMNKNECTSNDKSQQEFSACVEDNCKAEYDACYPEKEEVKDDDVKVADEDVVETADEDVEAIDEETNDSDAEVKVEKIKDSGSDGGCSLIVL